MNLDRETLKRAGVALLDAVADEHPMGHQGVYSNRYVLTAPGGAPIEVMFEKRARTKTNLWCLRSAAAALVECSIEQRLSPSSSLRTTIGKAGDPSYGRHSALQGMPQLGDADLVCLVPKSLEELGQIIDTLLAASAAGTT